MSSDASDEPIEEIGRVWALRLTERARTDIDQEYTRLSAITPDVADEWKEGVLDAIASLSQLPRRCKLAPENERFRYEVRQLLYRRRSSSPGYRILFTLLEPSEDAPFIRVFHIRHGAARPISRDEAQEM